MKCIENTLWIHAEPFAAHRIGHQSLMQIGLNALILLTVPSANEAHEGDFPRVTCLKVSKPSWDIIRITNLYRITPIAPWVSLSEEVYCHPSHPKMPTTIDAHGP